MTVAGSWLMVTLRITKPSGPARSSDSGRPAINAELRGRAENHGAGPAGVIDQRESSCRSAAKGRARSSSPAASRVGDARSLDQFLHRVSERSIGRGVDGAISQP